MDFPLDYARSRFPSLSSSNTIAFNNLEEAHALEDTNNPRSDDDGDVEELLRETRESLAFFLNSNAEWAEEEIFIVNDINKLSEKLSFALATGLEPGSSIVTTDYDDAISLQPWHALSTKGFEVQHCVLTKQDAVADTTHLESTFSKKTGIVVMSKASASVGSIVELLPVARRVKELKSTLVVNWSSFLPHGPLDVRFLRSDFVLASTRMFFGADVGFLWGNRERIRELRRSVPNIFNGTSVKPEGLLRLRKALHYVEELGGLSQGMQLQPSEDYGRRGDMRRGMQAIRHYERTLTDLMLRRLANVPRATVFGISHAEAAAHRIPHVMFYIQGYDSMKLAEMLREEGVRILGEKSEIPVFLKSIGFSDDGGVLRASLLHYNSESEIERFIEVLNSVVPALSAI